VRNGNEKQTIEEIGEVEALNSRAPFSHGEGIAAETC